jgi:glyoxylase-like metal-dependent hydrolase (beta-lactamase superfamily II)
MNDLKHARRLVIRLAAALAIVAPMPAMAQAPEGPLWDSYSRALAVFRQGVQAHGGAEAIQRLTQVSFRWEGQDYAPTQGRVPSAAFDTTGNGRGNVQEVQIDFARNRYTVFREAPFPGGYLNTFRMAGDGKHFLFNNASAARGMGGTTYQRDTTGAAARRNLAQAAANMPVLLLRTALGRISTLRYLGEHTVGGRREEAITFTTAEGDPVTLYFDAGTHLLTRREDMGLGALGDEVDVVRFGDYRTEAGLAVPGTMEMRWNGILTGRHRLARFAPVAEIPDSLLRPPAGFTEAQPGGPPAAVQVAEGVYYIERIGGGYRMLVVDTDEGLLAVDAPLSPEATAQALALIERTFPGRPLRYVAITHHHADHVGGIPAFAARGATVLAAAGSEGYLGRMATVRRTIGRIAAPEPVPAVRIEAVRGRRTIGRGARRVEVIEVSPTSHASSMLVVYLPEQKLLFQGDLLRINREGGPVVSPEATRDLQRIIQQFGLDVRSIGAVHGENGTPDDLRTALARGSSTP